MLLPIRDLLVLLIAAVLFALIHATVSSSRKQNIRFDSYRDYLFRGREAVQSLSGNMGAVFSLTGFVGATWVYAVVFGGWIVVVTIIVFIALVKLTTAIMRRIDADGVTDGGNVLLHYLQKHLAPRDFERLVTIYSFVYFTLLVEELAAARLLLREMVPDPVVMSFLLILAVFTIYTYVHLGGFRAVVTADTVQIVVLLAFSLFLTVIVVSHIDGSIVSTFRLRTLDMKQSFSLLGAAVFGFAWFAPALDFYARLNFSRRTATSTPQFIRLSYTLTFALLMIGALFGTVMSSKIRVDASNAYPSGTVEFFLNSAPPVALLFICAIFSMLFTTLDTMMITALQVGYYQPRRLFRRETLPTLVLVATFLSTQIEFADASVLGIFTGSILALPLLAILRCFWPGWFRWLPENTSYLFVAAAASLVFLGLRYGAVSRDFHGHFHLSLLVLGTALVAGGATTLFQRWEGASK